MKTFDDFLAESKYIKDTRLKSFEVGIMAKWLEDGMAGIEQTFSREEAFKEAYRLSKSETKIGYFGASRVGSKVALNRKDRASIWSLWENAKRHAHATYVEDQKKRAENQDGVDYLDKILSRQEQIDLASGHF